MGSKNAVNGEAAALKKRKRGPKDDAPATPKRPRAKSNAKARASVGADDLQNADDDKNTALVPTADGDLELPDASNALAIREAAAAAWKVSNPMGGRILDIDPIFSSDERSVMMHRMILVANR